MIREGHAALVQPDEARGQFLCFKRLVWEHRGEHREGVYHSFRAEELFTEIFGGERRGNQRVYKGMSISIHLKF